MKKLTNVQLQGYLFDAVTALLNDMQAFNGFVFGGKLGEQLSKVERIATIKKVTFSEISTAFDTLADIRKNFDSIKRLALSNLVVSNIALVSELRKNLDKVHVTFTPELLAQFRPIWEAVVFRGNYTAATLDIAKAHHALILEVISFYNEKVKEKQEEEARKEAERLEKERKKAELVERLQAMEGNGFKVNNDAIVECFTVDEYEDRQQIREQLDDAPLFRELSADDMYMKRHDIMKPLTNGYDVIELKAVDFTDFIKRFERQMKIELDSIYYKLGYSTYREVARFFRDGKAMKKGLVENLITTEHMDLYSIRSPKYSKHLVKTFGEKSTIVKMFNDRPKPEQLEKEEVTVLEEYSVYVSHLASNVMKMTAGNRFDSCQNYDTDDSDALDYLQKLPSSVHDELLSIAYVTDAGEGYTSPTMEARALITPHVFNGQLFYIAYNVYGDYNLLKSSLKNAYGDRILFANELYSNEDMHRYEHDYDYSLIVKFDYDSTCYMCDGDGEVEVEVRYHGYRFNTECPECEGSGNNGESEYGAHPYVNEGSRVYYSSNSKYSSVDVDLLVSILSKELENLEDVAV